MITVSIKQKNKTLGVHERHFEVPSSWEELTLEQFNFIMSEKEMNEIKLLAILTGLSEDYLSQLPADSLHITGNYLSAMIGVPDISKWELPKRMLIDGKEYDVPTLEKQTFGQKVYLQEELNRVNTDKRPFYDAFAFAIATMFYSEISGDKHFTEEKVRALIPVVLRTKAKQAIPVASFFLTSCARSLNAKKRTSVLNRLRRNLTRELTTSKSSES